MEKVKKKSLNTLSCDMKLFMHDWWNNYLINSIKCHDSNIIDKYKL